MLDMDAEGDFSVSCRVVSCRVVSCRVNLILPRCKNQTRHRFKAGDFCDKSSSLAREKFDAREREECAQCCLDPTSGLGVNADH